MKSIIILGILLVLIPMSAGVAQLPGDYNCNGQVNGIDLTYLANAIHFQLLDTTTCTWLNGDLDGDSINHSIGDWYRWPVPVDSIPNPPPPPPDVDTISIENADGAPGQSVQLPITIVLADNALAAALHIRFDTTFFYNPQIRQWNGNQSISIIVRAGEIYLQDFSPYEIDTLLAGSYNLARLNLMVRENVPTDTTLPIKIIGGDYYPSGFANASFPTFFIRPVLVNGAVHIVPLTGLSENQPRVFDLGLTNFPNPFNSSTEISFNLAEQAQVEINIYDILGQKVSQLYDGQLQAGDHHIDWNAGHMPSGIYFYTLMTDSGSYSKRMILLK